MIRDMTRKGVLTNPGMIFQILEAITESLATSEDWASLNTLQAFGLSLGDLKPANITMITTPNKIIENGNVAWTEDANLIWQSLSKDARWPIATAMPSPTPSQIEFTLPVPSEISVLVLNGTSKSGLARKVAPVIEGYGFQISDYASTDSRPLATEIRYNPINSLQAQSLKSALGIGTLVPDQSIETGVTLILGKDWVTPPTPTQPSETIVAAPSLTPVPSPTADQNSVSAGDSTCLDLK
jgi:hypothetical protein